jgi:hypothetical protein
VTVSGACLVKIAALPSSHSCRRIGPSVLPSRLAAANTRANSVSSTVSRPSGAIGSACAASLSLPSLPPAGAAPRAARRPSPDESPETTRWSTYASA